MDKKEFQPNELAEICQINKSTLQRHLDDREMISPIRVDENNGYRYYDQSAINKLKLLKVLQKKPFRLNKNEIKPILLSADLRTMLEHYEQSEQSLRAFLMQKEYF